MQEWYRDPISSRLVRNTTLAHTPLPDTIPIMANHISLQDKFYPIRTSLPSCILLPEANGNNFELKPQFINSFPRFYSLESEETYFFIREFEEVCLMMRISQLGEDAVRLRFIPFALKDIAKSGYIICLLVLSRHGMILSRTFLRSSIPSIKRPSSGKT